ncbi:hypothetical protein ARZXY2_3622 [Arthrobacter sp. ZXY-2]|nr:hypothetical protein ARZXY2_3622 [Arthrobacter sp. ZXY-2]
MSLFTTGELRTSEDRFSTAALAPWELEGFSGTGITQSK